MFSILASLIIDAQIVESDTSRTNSCFSNSFKVEFEVSRSGDLKMKITPSTITKVVYSIESLDSEHYDFGSKELKETSSISVPVESLPPGDYNIVVAGLCQGRQLLTGKEPLVKSQFRIEANN